MFTFIVTRVMKNANFRWRNKMTTTAQGLKYTVDIVLCIDATASMGSIIERVKSSALKFYEDVSAKLKEKDKFIDSLRIKVISFRDYFVDGANAMQESPFFTLPQDKEGFTAFVTMIRADGGGDEPENGMEALALAMKSDWSKIGDRRRQVTRAASRRNRGRASESRTRRRSAALRSAAYHSAGIAPCVR